MHGSTTVQQYADAPCGVQIFPGLELELGFVQQFASLIELDSTDLDMLAAVEEVSGGVEPRHVVVSGGPSPILSVFCVCCMGAR